MDFGENWDTTNEQDRLDRFCDHFGKLFRIIKLTHTSIDTKQWTCELFVENKELIKSNMYEACIRRIPTKKDSTGGYSLEQLYNHSNYNDIIMLINSKHIIAISSGNFRLYPTYEFHIKITISYRGVDMITHEVELPKQIATMPHWFGAAKTLIDSSDLSDFTYVVQGKEFKVHKLILSLASPVFRSTFECGLDETRDNKAIVTDCDPGMFQHLLNFIYKGDLPDNIQEIVLDLFKLAHVYQIQPLQNICLNRIMLTQLSQDSVVELYDAAITYELDRLKNNCWTFIKLWVIKWWRFVKNSHLLY